MNEYDDPIVGEIKSVVPFPVDVKCESFPDVFFIIMLETTPDPSVLEKIAAALNGYMLSYNKKHFIKPIHYVSDAELHSDCSIFIHIDLGNASPKALVGAVKAVADINLPVRRLILE